MTTPTSPAPSDAVLLNKKALSGLHVLIVDDEPVLASTFCLLLKHAGAEAQSAPHGRAALELLAHRSFDVILCDKHMPEMNGTELIRTLNRANDATPILLFVSTLDSDGMDELSSLRVTGTLTKPLLPGDLIHAIQRAAGLR